MLAVKPDSQCDPQGYQGERKTIAPHKLSSDFNIPVTVCESTHGTCLRVLKLGSHAEEYRALIEMGMREEQPESMLLARRDWSMSPKVSRDTSIKNAIEFNDTAPPITLDAVVRWNTQVLEHLIWTQ